MENELNLKELRALADIVVMASRPSLATEDFAPPPKAVYCPHTPYPPQKLFLDLTCLDAFLGGEVGGGKSDALLMAALQYVEIPDYSALLIMKTLADLSKPKALMDRAHRWLSGSDARWNGQLKRYTFPSGATLDFGYLANENDKYNYRTAEYQFIGIDELTRFPLSVVKYMFSRLRRLRGSNVPLRFRSASNPGQAGEPGAIWVAERYVPPGFSSEQITEPCVLEKAGVTDEGEKVVRYFVPSRTVDNPSLDKEEYDLALSELDVVSRGQLQRGDWQIRQQGDIYWMFDSRYIFVPWSRFQRVFGTSHIPNHWLESCIQDQGTKDGHPNCTGWFATAGKNSRYPDMVVMYRAHMVVQHSPSDVGQAIQILMGMTPRAPNDKIPYKDLSEVNEEIFSDGLGGIGERSRCGKFLNSHEAESERLEYKKMKPPLPFASVTHGANIGIAQMRNRLGIIERDKPNPFFPELMGRTRFICAVPDDDWPLRNANSVWARVEAEFQAYHYEELKSGEVNKRVVPHPLFNDFMDVCRYGAFDAFPRVRQLTDAEALNEAMPEPIKDVTINELPPAEKGWAITERLQHIAEQRLDKRGRQVDDDEWDRIYNS